MAKLAIDRASIVFGKKKSGDFHSKSGDREFFIILSKIGRSPEKSGDLEALLIGAGFSSSAADVLDRVVGFITNCFRNKLCVQL